MNKVAAIYVEGEWCVVVPLCESPWQAIVSYGQIIHPELGLLNVVPRSFPIKMVDAASSNLAYEVANAELAT